MVSFCYEILRVIFFLKEQCWVFKYKVDNFIFKIFNFIFFDVILNFIMINNI